jgi:hypothetical protein
MCTVGAKRHIVITAGLPEGAKFIRGWYDGEHNIFGLLYEHESFPETPDGEPWRILQVLWMDKGMN